MRISKKLIRASVLLLLITIIFGNTCFANSSSITDSSHNCWSFSSDYGTKCFTFYVSATENYTISGSTATGTSRNLFIYDFPNLISGTPGLYNTTDKAGTTQLLKLYRSNYVSGSYWLPGDRTYYMHDDNTATFSYNYHNYSSTSTISTSYALDSDWTPGIFTCTDTFTILN